MNLCSTTNSVSTSRPGWIDVCAWSRATLSFFAHAGRSRSRADSASGRLFGTVVANHLSLLECSDLGCTALYFLLGCSVTATAVLQQRIIADFFWLFMLVVQGKVEEFFFFFASAFRPVWPGRCIWALSVCRSRLAPWTRGEPNHGKLSALRPLGHGRYRLATASARERWKKKRASEKHARLKFAWLCWLISLCDCKKSCHVW